MIIFILRVGGTSFIMALANRRTNRSACLEQFFFLDKLSFKKKSISLGLVVSEESLICLNILPRIHQIIKIRLSYYRNIK